MFNTQNSTNEMYIKGLLKNYSDFIIVSETNLSGIITYASGGFSRVSQYSVDELIGKNHNIVRDPNNDPAIFENLWKRIKNGETVELKSLSNKAKDGSLYYVDATILPIKQNDTITGYRSLRIDVTDKVKLDKLTQNLKKDNNKLSHILEETKEDIELFKEDIVSIFTHELKTPLNAILNYAEYISRNINENLNERKVNKLKTLALKITNHSKIQNDMIDSLLFIVQIKSGKIIPEKKILNIHEILNPIIDRYTGLHQKEVILDIDDIEVYADKKICSIVFTNLYSNAIKYSHSKVLISVKSDNKGSYKITVEDDGKGINKEDRESIFDMFTKIGSKDLLTREQQGTGIGLYTVKNLIHICGKSITVEDSKTLGGSAFVIEYHKD